MQLNGLRGLRRKETRLSEPLRSESELSHAADLAPMPEENPVQGIPTAAELIAAQEARRQKRARRKNLRLVGSDEVQAPESEASAAANVEEVVPPREVAPTQRMIEAELRRMSRETRQNPEFSVRADRQARNASHEPTSEAADSEAPNGIAETASAEAASPVNAEDGRDMAAADTEAAQSSKAHRRRANTADKARRRNSASGSEETTLLVRQLSLTTQQLNAAHRVIGRLSAERDILRQHFADAVGIPVDEVVIATDTDVTETVQKKVHVEATPPSRLAKLNYFGGDDIAQMRRRRQTFVLVLLGFILALWGLARAGFWSMPDNLSRDSLGQLPLIGDLMTYFLAGWLFFRVAKVSSKGVRWVFPAETRQRRRR